MFVLTASFFLSLALGSIQTTKEALEGVSILPNTTFILSEEELSMSLKGKDFFFFEEKYRRLVALKAFNFQYILNELFDELPPKIVPNGSTAPNCVTTENSREV